ncbi:ubiquinone biosynthesis accessory factor UbiJ [Alteromonas sp. BMJM2]|uniref:ubiquinone biosynthesis accessory factor UbiJ n=1 Tax=Alteromonas sp. BMJM2 TaxID=2954241 RepID=UPI0022B48B25|nr:SCP2 sterol-binding domain-containing protein [Alteromonas sp. BMJM2]
MPASALFAATLEASINKLLALDSDSKARLNALDGSRMTAFLSPIPFGITLVFSDKVDVLIEHGDFEEVKAQLGAKDCCIKTSLDTLPALKETSQLTRLIQQKALYLEGELNVAQQASSLFKDLDIDVEELIAIRTNDVFAHQSMKTVKAIHEKSMSMFANMGDVFGNALVEEKKLAAHKLAVMHFSDEVSALRDSTERLDARLRDLEERLK